ncbi:MAG: PEP/pyruvate-binding domain-containing protein [Acidobacteriota bacterium]
MWNAGRGADVADEDLRHRYRVLRRVLAANSELLERMADLEADLALFDLDEPSLRVCVRDLLDGSLLLAENLNLLTGGDHQQLYRVHAEIARELDTSLEKARRAAVHPLVTPLREVRGGTAREAGGKAANLGELRAARPDLVPEGLVVTTSAFRHFLDANGLRQPIRSLSRDLDLLAGQPLFRERTGAIRALVTASPMPPQLAGALENAVSEFSGVRRWAVRSSAVGEDGKLSFAGQFESVLDVEPRGLGAAYARVLASRWNDRAVLYRLYAGIAEVETPMAVLLLPMVDAAIAGVLYTRDPAAPHADRMVADHVAGLADAMVRGDAQATTTVLRRGGTGGTDVGAEGLPERLGAALLDAGTAAEELFGGPQDLEWVWSPEGRLWVVQSRPLRIGEVAQRTPEEPGEPLLAGGMAIFPGRASGPVHLGTGAAAIDATPEGAVLVVAQATPELSAALPRLAALIAEQGNPAGHAAALAREFAVPTLFGVPGALERLEQGAAVSIDAGQRRVWAGSLWPEVRERVRSRIRHSARARRGHPVHDRILALNLSDPLARTFRASACRSVHDIVRFCHEIAVAAMFRLGDTVSRGGRRVWRLESPVPLNLWLLDLGGAVPQDLRAKKRLKAEQVESAPFQALWRGMGRQGVTWAGRSQVSLKAFASVLTASIHDARAPVRELGGANYLLVAPDYVSLNARLAYHFTMVDAHVGEAAENNFVNFRFRGGAAGVERRDLRARFLAEVLLRSGFGVDRRGDLVTAWLRRFPAAPSLVALELLGALTGCARQLDMLMTGEAAMRDYVDRFLAGDYAAFS